MLQPSLRTFSAVPCWKPWQGQRLPQSTPGRLQSLRQGHDVLVLDRVINPQPYTWTPQVCRIMAFWAIFLGFGPGIPDDLGRSVTLRSGAPLAPSRRSASCPVMAQGSMIISSTVVLYFVMEKKMEYIYIYIHTIYGNSIYIYIYTYIVVHFPFHYPNIIAI